MKLSIWQRAQYWVLLLLVFLITISSHPTIMSMSYAEGITNGTILSRYIILTYGILFVMCFNLKSMFKPRFVCLCWIIYLVIGLYFSMTQALFNNNSMMIDLRLIIICLVAVMIGWQMKMDEKRFHWLLIVYAGLTLFVGLMQVFTNVGGFVILDQYLTDNKNALGVMLSTSALIFLLLGLNNKKKSFYKIIAITLAILTLVVLLTIRARTSTITTFLMIVFVLSMRFRGRYVMLFLLMLLILFMVAYLFMPESIRDYIYASFYQNYEKGNFTTYRIERDLFALNFLSEHFLWGNLDQNLRVADIHNYILNRTFEFGIVFVFPILLLYFYIIFYIIRETIKTDIRNNHNMGYFLLLIPFIISMAEYTFPYGPGTATVFNYLLLGLALRNTYNERLNEKVFSPSAETSIDGYVKNKVKKRTS